MNTLAASDLISVIIPAYNAQETLVTALDSVRKQTGHFQFEVFVIDDGSTDHTAEVAQKYAAQHPEFNLIILQQLNQGVSAARNAGMERSSGEYIALLDADDEWLQEKTEKQMHYFHSEHLDLIAARRTGQRLLFPYKCQVNKLAKITFRKLLFRNEAQPSTVIFRKTLIQKTGIFNQDQRHAEDLNLWLRMSLKGKMAILDEELILAGSGKRSFGVAGLSANLPEMEKGFQRSLKELYEAKQLGPMSYIAYSAFFSAKYIFRVSRNRYLLWRGR